MKTNLILIAVVILSSINAHAEGWQMADYFGVHYGAKDAVTATANGVTSHTDTPGSASFTDGIEGSYNSNNIFGASFIFDYSDYQQSSSLASDKMIGLMVAPRLQQSLGDFNIWAEIGVGIDFTVLGTTDLTVGSVTAHATSSTLTSFVWSPRIGVDYQIGDKYFIGLQESYTSTSPSVDVMVNTVTVHESVTRHYFATAFRFGVNFGSKDKPEANDQK